MNASTKVTVLLSSTAVFLIALELTIISVALPEIEAAFPESTRAVISWVFTAYSVGVASLLLIAGWLAERLGRKRIFIVGMSIFALGSFVSGQASTIEMLIGGRVVQAIGGAFLLPASLALLLGSVPADKREMAIGIWGSMAGLAAAAGPTLGAFLVDSAGWRWVFLINVPIAVAAVALGEAKLVESRDQNIAPTVDLLAVPSGALAVAAIVFAMTAGGSVGWSDPRILVALASAAVLGTVFVHRSTTHERPVFAPSLARRRSFAVGGVATVAFGAAFTGWLALAPSFVAEVWGYSTLRSGLAIAPAPVMMAIVARPAGNLTATLGHRKVISLGSLLGVAATAWWVAFIGAEPSYLVGFLPGALLLGTGVGICFPMLTAASMRDVPSHQYAMGAAGNTTLRQTAIALGIAVSVTIVGADAISTSSVGAFKASWAVAGALFTLTSAVMWFAYPAASEKPVEAAQPVTSLHTLPVSPQPSTTFGAAS